VSLLCAMEDLHSVTYTVTVYSSFSCCLHWDKHDQGFLPKHLISAHSAPAFFVIRTALHPDCLASDSQTAY
jgi:hypothetical protein